MASGEAAQLLEVEAAPLSKKKKSLTKMSGDLEPIIRYSNSKNPTQTDARSTSNLEELHKRVIGQDQAVFSISRAIRRNQSGIVAINVRSVLSCS